MKNKHPKNAVESFAALAQETRLSIFRLLIKEGTEGLVAGDIAKRLTVHPSTLSGHLNLLTRSGLLRSKRRQRHIVYSVDINGTRRLLKFLTDDCCKGHPEICGDLGVI